MEQRRLIKQLIFHKQTFIYFTFLIFDKAIQAFAYNIVMAIVVRDLFNATAKGRSDLFLRGLIFAIASLFIATLLQPLFIYLSKRAQKRRMADLREQAFQEMVTLKIPFFEQESEGAILHNLSEDLRIIEDLYDKHIPRILFMVFLGLGSLFMMVFYSLPLTLLALFFEGLSIIMQVKLAKKVRQKSKLVQERKSHVQEQVMTNLHAYTTSKLYGLHEKQMRKFEASTKDLARHEKAHGKRLIQLTTIEQGIYTAKTIGLIALGVYLIFQGQSDIGSLFAIMNLMNNLGLLSKLGEQVGQMQSSLEGVSRLENLYKEEKERPREKTSIVVKDPVIDLKQVNFAYLDQVVLRNFSIQVNKGEKLALKGPSGSGKSTLAKLLLGFYPVHTGQGQVLGQDIKDACPGSLRKSISYVGQRPQVFTGTIKDNILLGRANASLKDIIEASKKAHAHDFIMEQEEGYDTMITEDGGNLSSGQKQRICLARAFLKDAPLLLLDEPTSALDPRSSKQIESVIEELSKQDQSILLITHHLYNPSIVDRTICLSSQ